MLFDATLEEMRPPMGARVPTEDAPWPVVAWPGWVWWRDRGLYCARRPGRPEVRDEKFYTAMLARIRRAEGGHGDERTR